ncbi:hypothetical protein N7486_001390 [Penicillium sp. IBT 16267x]|nr:hypothetical protein N7486_001390 [Penicillium sp. IBT 16267x]
MFELEIRLPVGLVTDEVMAVIEAVVPRYPDATVELKRQEAASNPSSFSSVDHPIIEHLKENANAVGGVQRGLFPPWVLQIASITVAAVNESASVDEFLHVTEVYALATWDLLY